MVENLKLCSQTEYEEYFRLKDRLSSPNQTHPTLNYVKYTRSLRIKKTKKFCPANVRDDNWWGNWTRVTCKIIFMFLSKVKCLTHRSVNCVWVFPSISLAEIKMCLILKIKSETTSIKVYFLQKLLILSLWFCSSMTEALEVRVYFSMGNAT